jgi:CheY-like chemotaxis protein
MGRPFDLVLLDMQMPEMDGEQTLEKISGDPELAATPVIVLTSMGQRGDADQLQAKGCAAYLLKPVKLQTLRRTLEATVGRSAARETRRSSATQAGLASNGRGVKLLLVEDNPVNQKLAVILLRKAGYTVDVAENGLRAIEQIGKRRYDAVLMDVQMPEMDGYAATRLIREQLQLDRLPIIAMTANAMKGDEEQCRAAGMDDYVSKPFALPKFIQVLDRWVAGSPTAGSRTAPAEPCLTAG